MWKLVLGAAAGKAIAAILTLGSVLFVMQLVPRMMSWLPGFSSVVEDGNRTWTFNLLNPLSNALQYAPAGVNYAVSYWYIDLAITLGITGMLWGLVLKVVTK